MDDASCSSKSAGPSRNLDMGGAGNVADMPAGDFTTLMAMMREEEARRAASSGAPSRRRPPAARPLAPLRR